MTTPTTAAPSHCNFLMVASCKLSCVSLWSEYNLCSVTFRTPCAGKSNCWCQKGEASNVKHLLYTVCRQWTGGDVMNCFVTFEGKWELW